MKKFVFSTALICSIATQVLFAQKIPNKKEVLKVLKSTNAYFMNKWPDAGKSIITNKERPSNIWTRAVYYEGLMNLYKISPEKAYYDYAVQWGQKHNWGLRNGIATKNADDQACGQTYIDLYLIDKQPERIKDIKASIDLVMQSGKVNDWTWIDAIQMGMPFCQTGQIIQRHQLLQLHVQNVPAFEKYRRWWLVQCKRRALVAR